MPLLKNRSLHLALQWHRHSCLCAVATPQSFRSLLPHHIAPTERKRTGLPTAGRLKPAPLKLNSKTPAGRRRWTRTPPTFPRRASHSPWRLAAQACLPAGRQECLCYQNRAFALHRPRTAQPAQPSLAAVCAQATPRPHSSAPHITTRFSARSSDSTTSRACRNLQPSARRHHT